MSFATLDSEITNRLEKVNSRLTGLKPYLKEMRTLLSRQGKRTDLRGVPKGMTWQKWVSSKQHVLGSLSTVKRLLSDKAKKPAGDNKRQLTIMEARLLGVASAGHDLVRAIRQNGNTDEAVREYLDKAPTLERIEEFIGCPRKVTECPHCGKGLE
jgi:hypothetical protein